MRAAPAETALFLQLPANSLGMIIHRDGQAAAATQAAALENLTPVRGGHTLAETVDTQAAMNMGLVGSFGRHARSFRYLACFSILTALAKQNVAWERPFVSLTPEFVGLASVQRQTNGDYTSSRPDGQTFFRSFYCQST
jgi:hypothetical protein